MGALISYADSRNILRIAVHSKQVRIISYLLSNKPVNVDEQDSVGQTALYLTV